MTSPIDRRMRSFKQRSARYSSLWGQRGRHEPGLQRLCQRKIQAHRRQVLFSKEEVKDGTIVFDYIPTSDKTADVFTKILPAATHKEMALKLGMTRS